MHQKREEATVYQALRRWRGASLSSLNLLAESVTVADASRFLTPLTIAIPVLTALWETSVIPDSVLVTATVAIAAVVLLYWMGAVSKERKDRYSFSVRSLRSRTVEALENADLSEYQRSVGYSMANFGGRLFLKSPSIDE